MSSKYGVVNVLLFFVVLLLIFKNIEIWTPPSMTDKKEGGKKIEGQTESLPALTSPPSASVRESLLGIGEKNIFNPDRKEFSILTGETAKPVSRPTIQLYGVVITNEVQTASISNPTRLPARGERELKTIKVGDRVEGYQLTKILPDRVILEAPGDTYEVLLYDPKSPKRRAVIRTPSKPAETMDPRPVPTPTPLPSSPSAAPRSFPIPSLPGSMEYPAIPQVESATPKPVSPTPIPDRNILRGRRAITPGLPAAGGTN
jgi:hypothetical protein